MHALCARASAHVRVRVRACTGRHVTPSLALRPLPACEQRACMEGVEEAAEADQEEEQHKQADDRQKAVANPGIGGEEATEVLEFKQA